MKESEANGMAKKKNPVQRKSALSEIVRRNFKDSGSKIRAHVSTESGETREQAGSSVVHGIILQEEFQPNADVSQFADGESEVLVSEAKSEIGDAILKSAVGSGN